MSPMRKWRVNKLVDEHFWSGFWSYCDHGLGPGRVLSYSTAPQWWDDVADIASRAGWRAASEVIERWMTISDQIAADKPHFGGLGRAPRIPAVVYAEAYAAAR